MNLSKQFATTKSLLRTKEEKKEEIKITNEQNEENHENNEIDIAKEENIDKSIEKNEADNISKDIKLMIKMRCFLKY